MIAKVEELAKEELEVTCHQSPTKETSPLSISIKSARKTKIISKNFYFKGWKMKSTNNISFIKIPDLPKELVGDASIKCIRTY